MPSFVHVFFSTEGNTYRLVHRDKLTNMWNSVFAEHRAMSPKCKGTLVIDNESEKQVGLCWQEAARCTKCEYKSGRFKLYHEVRAGKRGPKCAGINRTAAAGLTKTRTDKLGLRVLMLSMMHPAPGQTALQRRSNEVCDRIEEVVKEDLTRERTKVKEVCRIRGDEPSTSGRTVIDIESDGQYNNPIFYGSAAGNTPYQSGTQTSYAVFENVTHKKKCVAVDIRSKLCNIGHGTEKECPTHEGICRANVKEQESIGNEVAGATACIKDLLEDGIEVGTLTSDADTDAYRAARKLYVTGKSATKPKHELCTVHVSRGQKRIVKKQTFSNGMLPGRTEVQLKRTQDRFSHDVARRCTSECNNAHKQFAGDTKKVERALAKLVPVIISCYQGGHNGCRSLSFSCRGNKGNNWLTNTSYLPRTFRIRPNTADIAKLTTCIEYRLGTSMLKKTSSNRNTNKAEAANRSIVASVVRGVTYTRNYSGRVHSAVNTLNRGLGGSVHYLMGKLDSPVPAGSRVARQLLSIQKMREKQSQWHATDKAKKARMAKRKARYKLHATTMKDREGYLGRGIYKRGMLLPGPTYQQRIRHDHGDYYALDARRRVKRAIKTLTQKSTKHTPKSKKSTPKRKKTTQRGTKSRKK